MPPVSDTELAPPTAVMAPPQVDVTAGSLAKTRLAGNVSDRVTDVAAIDARLAIV